MKNFIIIGMPGSGKTTIGRIAAKKAGLDFIDLDEMIVRRYGNIDDIFSEKGEKKFRAIEHEVLKEAVSHNSTVISAGGGIIERQVNLDILTEHTVIFINRKLSNIKRTLDSDSRPLLKDKTDAINKLYKRRHGKYLNAMDYEVENNGKKSECILKIVDIINKSFK